jgi:hypothetical protein
LTAAEQVTKMLLTEDNDMIQAISPDGADEPFGVSILPGWTQQERRWLSSHTELGQRPASISILISSVAAKIGPLGCAPWAVRSRLGSARFPKFHFIL